MTNEHGPLIDGLDATVRVLRWVGLVVLVAVLLSGVTIVGPDEVGLRLRFGRLTGTSRAEQVHRPGLLLSLPYLFDEVIRVPVRRVQEVSINGLSAGRQVFGAQLDITRDGYAITGDDNIVQLRGVAKYQIVDPVVWTLRVEGPETVLQHAVVAALTRTLAETSIDAVLVDARAALITTALERAQLRLDEGGRWVRLLALEITELAAPASVAGAFEEVQSAFVQKKTQVDEARRYREQQLPLARAEAATEGRQAEAHEAEQLSRARGAASAFLAVLDEQRRDPAIVRQRLYREAMETVMAQVGNQVLIDPRSARGRVLIPVDRTDREWRGPK
jgi:modulator of FtsH protease HflK